MALLFLKLQYMKTFERILLIMYYNLVKIRLHKMRITKHTFTEFAHSEHITKTCPCNKQRIFEL